MSRASNLAGFTTSISPPANLSVGIITASSVINVGTGLTLSSGGINITGVITATSFSGNGSGLTGVGLGTTGSINTSGIITATSFFGSGSGLTGVGLGTTGSINTSGIITASSFSGNGSGLTGVAATTLTIGAGTTALPSISPTGDSNTGIFFPSADTIAFGEGGAEAMRVDSSGRLLVGTASTAYSDAILTARGGATTNTGEFNIASKENNITSDTLFAAIRITNTNGGRGAEITATADANWTNGSSHPTRLIFATTDSAQTTPTERMRITSTGQFLVGKTSSNNTSNGALFTPSTNNFYLSLVNNAGGSNDRVLLINRQNSDGNLIDLYQAESNEGSISVSGTTVTYGGGHLARWSQLPNNEDPAGILKGTVMSNLDEMCEWGEEDNEQLNKTKVSDVEGDRNVAGLFVSTSFSEDGPLDFFVGMTGDMVIRIAEGVTVERGDLLMSAGDGTAKPQDDDIIRSKTVAKVTSTNVTCTYEDGSYCVPCVLMAC